MFPIFRDGTGVIQGVVSQKEHPEAFAALKGLPQESSVIASGTIQAEPRAPGGCEMHVSEIEVVQRVADSEPYPIQLKEHGVDFLLDQPAPLDSHAAPGRHSADSRGSRSRRAQFHG